MRSIFITLLFLSGSALWAQNLFEERIWKVSDRKRSVFFNKGVFHSTVNSTSQILKNVRNSYVQDRGYERVVFDFDSNTVPKVYGYIDEKKVYIDFFNTVLEKELSKVRNVKYVKNINFYNIDTDSLSVEIEFNSDVSVDIFYLESPGRFVIDIKK